MLEVGISLLVAWAVAGIVVCLTWAGRRRHSPGLTWARRTMVVVSLLVDAACVVLILNKVG